MKPQVAGLLFGALCVNTAGGLERHASFLGADASVRKDGGVSSRFQSEMVVQADSTAREAQLEKMQEQLQQMQAAIQTMQSEGGGRASREVVREAEVTAVETVDYANYSAFLEAFPGGWTGTNLPPPGQRVPPFKQEWYDPRFPYGRNVIITIITVLNILQFAWWLSAECNAQAMLAKHEESKNSEDGTGEDVLIRSPKDMEQDTYGFAIVSLIRDLHYTALEQGDLNLRQTRMLCSVGLLFFTFLIQIFITLQVKKFVTAKWVYGIRHDYEAYERHMYGDDPAAYTIGAPHPIFPVVAGYRGNPGYFMPGNFPSLDEGVKESVCNIPFSQTPFFMCVLLIWSLTVVMEIRMSISVFRSLIINTETLKNMKGALKDLSEDLPDDDPDNRWVVQGLTLTVKLMITTFVLLPRFLLACFLLWLGCRFLAATNDFGEMVLNAVALEFVLLVKDLLYNTVVPDRNKREIEKICVLPSSPLEVASYWTYLGTFSWGLVAMSWVYYYIFLIQMVLPQYRWDVRPLCTPWLHAKYGAYA
eukprot:TRINITY_DN75057_c0_g1_i1.p1 TRINITY_DN75057_c0_g1~~TRINITY_DN75057_c0_g1_i1.p1  ORF type:complete len:532 (+),score=147.08 TRINITY_DN75057_c0_g1_i1:64-1659(+)